MSTTGNKMNWRKQQSRQDTYLLISLLLIFVGFITLVAAAAALAIVVIALILHGFGLDVGPFGMFTSWLLDLIDFL